MFWIFPRYRRSCATMGETSGALPNLRIQSLQSCETGQDCSFCSHPLSGAKVGVVGLHTQTRSPPFQQALRPGCSPTPPCQNPHTASLLSTTPKDTVGEDQALWRERSAMLPNGSRRGAPTPIHRRPARRTPPSARRARKQSSLATSGGVTSSKR